MRPQLLRHQGTRLLRRQGPTFWPIAHPLTAVWRVELLDGLLPHVQRGAAIDAAGLHQHLLTTAVILGHLQRHKHTQHELMTDTVLPHEPWTACACGLHLNSATSRAHIQRDMQSFGRPALLTPHSSASAPCASPGRTPLCPACASLC